jgi:iron complex outermembrane receptor protein
LFVKLWFLFVCVSLSAPASMAGAERFSLHGSIRDRTTADPLPSAHIRVLGTARGTITGTGGDYALHLEPGTYRIIVSMLGYRPDTATVRVDGPTIHNVDLTPAEIVLPEVVISSEDPAVEIIRRAIAHKRQWIDRLAT